ncbi:MAG: GNAT family N-acetyltransferase [Bacteroidales bacterium]|nr:GNAT family N-acetyltransferase [Bacteroidales bacterium]MBK7626600.1 GNAT family N-acetyltransferase [Bacteroidales bacterium]
MQIVEVLSKHDRREFIDFPKRLYKKDPFWVCQLDSALESVFDPATNFTFKHGEAVRWILRDDNGHVIGRVAAFIDRVRSAANSQPTGGLGYFEVIENRDAAFLLFDTARGWLSKRGMAAMDGPVNFGENDNNWGLLVDGFVQQGFGMPYHKKYYRAFFEEYGFKNYFEQYSYHREIRNADKEIVMFPERIMKIAEWLSKRPGYSFRHFEFRNKDKYVNDIVEIYNSTWSVFKEDFTPLDPAFLEESLKKAKYVVDEDLIWFAYFNDRPIAFFILFPDLNQILKHFNGSINPFNMLRFLYFRAAHKMTRMRAIVGGVHPSYQNSGVESAIFLQLYGEFKKKPWFKELELSWVGDYNPKMIAIYEALGAKKAKTHITYRYFINKDLPFKRYKEEMSENQGLNLDIQHNKQ